MLSDTIEKELKKIDKITYYFSNLPKKKIRRITYFDENSFGSGTDVYLMSKKTFADPADALCAGWLSRYLWEEDLENFDYSEPSCEEVAEIFMEETEKYIYQQVCEDDMKQYIALKIEPLLKKTAKVQRAESKPKDVGFLTKSGTYVDQAYTSDKAFIFKKNEEYIDGVILYEETDIAPYRELFFETDSKYVLFFE